MDDKDIIFIISGILFGVGIFGLLINKKIIKILISIEILLMSSILNFCRFPSENGYLAAACVLAIGVLTFCVAFSICCFRFKNNDKDINDV